MLTSFLFSSRDHQRRGQAWARHIFAQQWYTPVRARSRASRDLMTPSTVPTKEYPQSITQTLIERGILTMVNGHKYQRLVYGVTSYRGARIVCLQS